MRIEESETPKALLGTQIKTYKKNSIREREIEREETKRVIETRKGENLTLFIFCGWRREKAVRVEVNVKREEPKRKGKTEDKPFLFFSLLNYASVCSIIKSKVCSTVCHLKVNITYQNNTNRVNLKNLTFMTYIKNSRTIPSQNRFQGRCCKISTNLCNLLIPVSKPISTNCSILECFS